MKRARRCSALLVLAGCGQDKDEGISGGGKVIGKTVTVYSLTNDPGATSRDFVDGEKLALSDAGGRAGPLAVNFTSLDLGGDDTAMQAEAVRRAISDPQIIAAIVDATKVTVPLFNAAGILQVAPGGDRGLARDPNLLPSGKQTVEAPDGQRPGGLRGALQEGRRPRAGRRRRGRLPLDGRGHRRDREGGRGRQRPHPRHRVVLTSPRSFVSSVISGTAASAFESGQPSFAP